MTRPENRASRVKNAGPPTAEKAREIPQFEPIGLLEGFRSAPVEDSHRKEEQAMKDDELRIQTESSSLSEAALEGYVREIREQVPNCSVFIQEKILATRFFDRHPDDNRKVTGTEYWPFFVSVYLLKPLAGQKRIAHVDENIDDAMRHILDRIRRLKNIQKQEEEQA